MAFLPLGRQTSVNLTSKWGDPSFIGSYLPKSHQITDAHFDANWEVSYFARNYPQAWHEDQSNRNTNQLEQSRFGVSLITPVDFYQQTERSTKYGILFLALTFLVFFLFETLSKSRIHIVQYVLVGLALCLFYLLLLSLSELYGFFPAYLMASVPTVLLISLYTYAISTERKLFLSGLMGFMLVALYTYLYALLQLEDYALLFGTIGLFIVLAAFMYITRNIDWYAPKNSSERGSC